MVLVLEKIGKEQSSMIYNNVLEAIGNTPLIRLSRMVDEDSAEILVKFEGLNVGVSDLLYDRCIVVLVNCECGVALWADYFLHIYIVYLLKPQFIVVCLSVG